MYKSLDPKHFYKHTIRDLLRSLNLSLLTIFFFVCGSFIIFSQNLFQITHKFLQTSFPVVFICVVSQIIYLLYLFGNMSIKIITDPQQKLIVNVYFVTTSSYESHYKYLQHKHQKHILSSLPESHLDISKDKIIVVYYGYCLHQNNYQD